jgi:TP901 family phage tail tape measure protein
MANYDLGTAHGKVEINYDTGPMKRTKQDLDEVKSKGTSTGQAFDKTARGMGRSGLVIAAGFGLALKATADFEKSISGIGAVTGATGTQLDQVRSKALQLGRDTSFSASQAADAMGELAKAGISLPDIMNGAADATVALAAAGGVALPEAATLAANAMNQFNLSAKDMPKVADLIAGAANASAIDVSDFGQALSQVGAVAHSMGLSLGDTSTAIAVLGNAGIKGSDAGTSLKQMLISLANPTKKSADLMKELGFNAFDAQGHLKPLDAIAQGLQGSMKNLTPQARNAALSIIFGSDAARAGAVFFQNGAAGVDKMSAAMLKVKAADVAKKRMDNLSGSVEQLKGSVETAAIKFGEMGQGPLKTLIDSITKLINSFTNLSDGTQQTILVMVASIGGLALFGAGLIKTVRFVQDLIAVLKVLKVLQGISAVFSVLSSGVGLLNGALAALAANPIALAIALIVIAVAALIVGIVLLWKKSETFRSIVLGVWHAIQATIGAVVGAVIDFFHGLTHGIDDMGDSQSRFAQFGAILASAFFGTVRVLTSALKFLQTVWNAVWSVMAPVVKVAMAIITAVITAAFNILKAVFLVNMAIFKAAWQVWLFFVPILRAVWNLIVAIIKLAIAIIKLLIVVWLVALKVIWDSFWLAISTIVRAAWTVVAAIIRTAINVIVGIFRTGVAVWKAIINAIVRAIHAIMNSWIGQKIVGVVRSGVSGIIKIFNGLKSIAATIGKYFKAVYDAVSGPVGKVLKLLGGIGGKIVGYFKNAGKWLVTAGRNIIVGLINGITSMIRRLTGLLGSITDKIRKAKGPPKRDKVLLVDNAHLIMEGLMRGFRDRIPQLEKMLGKIGPGNIATSIARNETINASVSGTLGNATASIPAAARIASAQSVAATIDHAALVAALKEAGVGEATVELDGEVVSKRMDRISGRRTSLRRT